MDLQRQLEHISSDYRTVQKKKKKKILERKKGHYEAFKSENITQKQNIKLEDIQNRSYTL